MLQLEIKYSLLILPEQRKASGCVHSSKVLTSKFPLPIVVDVSKCLTNHDQARRSALYELLNNECLLNATLAKQNWNTPYS